MPEFLVHAIMGSEEAIKERTLYTQLPHNPMTSCSSCELSDCIFFGDNCKLKSVLSCFPAVKLKIWHAAALVSHLLTACRALICLRPCKDNGLHKTNVSIGKSLPLPSWWCEEKHTDVSSLQNLQRMFTEKASQERSTPISMVVVFQLTYNFRLLITAHTFNTFSSITSQDTVTRHEVVPLLQAVLKRFSVSDAGVK